jgi:hypothetical protein
LGLGHNQTEVYLYHVKYDYGITSVNMLEYPRLVNLEDIIDIANTPDNPYGITM